jgi:hypothetical protein
MTALFQVNDYFKLIALHKALMHAKFARNPIDPIISGSLYIAEIANQIVETLAQMEIERGYPERAQDWKMRIDPSGEVWQIALSRITNADTIWVKLNLDEKTQFARLLLSPFEYDDSLLQKFAQQVDERLKLET